MTKLKICTFNVKGINEQKKRRDVFSWLRKKNVDICLLQETHSTEQVENYWKNEWGYECYFSSFSGNSRGVAILFNNTFEYKLIDEKKDTEGRQILINFSVNGVKLTIANIYGPNQDDPSFFRLLQTKLDHFSSDHVIIGGDYNVVQDYTIDINNLCNRNNPNSNKMIIEMKEEMELCDPWRLDNPDTRMYTWHNTLNKQSRLDYFLISEDALPYVESTNIKPGYRSDHSVVELTLNLHHQPKGPGLWKFNNSLLLDEKYVSEIRQCILETKEQYKENNAPETDESLAKFQIPDQLLFEMLKLEIRGKTIAYSVAKKKELNKQEDLLNQNIEKFHKQYAENPSDDNLVLLTGAQNELQCFRERRIEGIITRAKARWHLEGEKNSKYFCNLERRHYNEKTISKLIDNSGVEITDPKLVLEEQKKFYENLYSLKFSEQQGKTNEIFFPERKNIRTLTEQESHGLEHDITLEECYTVLKNMKNNKSPGSDGFTVEFYRYFWTELKHPMIRSFQDAFKNGLLSDSQRLGIITCLPKPGKAKEYIKNWRPVTLLNVDYKILSGIIANRMKGQLDSLISESQKGFINGRYIGECTRLVSDLIYNMRKRRIAGIILLIDFEKAFDTLDHAFIERTLRYFNFGNNMCKWVKTFYSNIASSVTNNGHVSERFNIGRGVRQGDPLSPYLFLLAAEILSAAIVNDKDIGGIKIDGSEFLISQLADDTTLFLEPEERSFRRCMTLLDEFSNLSGLKVNWTKTLAVTIGLNNQFRYDAGFGNQITWQSGGKFTLLGIAYDLDKDDFSAINYENKIKDFEKTLKDWNARKLTIYGKICIIKSLALPKLVHLFSALPNPPDEMIQRLEKTCFQFIWNNKNEKIKRTTMQNSYENGGCKVPNIKYFCMAQKLTWVKKILDDNNWSSWKTLLISETEKYGGNYIWLTRNKKAVFYKHLNPFWKDVYDSWTALTKPEDLEDPLSQLLFHNESIQINYKSVFLIDWFMHGVKYVNDLVNEEGNIYTWEQFSRTYNISHPFEYLSVTQAIPRNWKKRIKEIGKKQNIVINSNIQKLKSLKKPSRYFYWKFMDSFCTRPEKSEKKWITLLDEPITENEWQHLYCKLPKITKETKLHALQMKIFHRILPTNSWLHKCNLTPTMNCDFCHIQRESIEHLFFECPLAKNIWLNLISWLNTIGMDDIKIERNCNMKYMLLGDLNGPLFLEHLKLITKDFIYSSKVRKIQPCFEHLKSLIRMKLKIEMMHSKKEFYYKKWDIRLIQSLGLV